MSINSSSAAFSTNFFVRKLPKHGVIEIDFAPLPS